MVVERRGLFPRFDDLIQPKHSADLHAGDLLLGSVVANVVSLGLGEDAEKGRIAICNPVSKSKPADKDGESGKDGVKEIEGSDCGDANKVKQRAFYSQVGERFMQALEDSICSDSCHFMVCHKNSPRGIRVLGESDERQL
jgi:hypothetical protein